MKQFDFLVIGGGIAGLSFALKAAVRGTVAVLFKKGVEDSSTAVAQGGIAAVSGADDNFDLHIADTLQVGAGLCRREIAELVVEEGPELVHELIELGAQFDIDDQQHFDLHLEGGHSRRRVMHIGDHTGHDLQQVLLSAARREENIQFFPESSAIDLITSRKLGLTSEESSRVLGAYVYRHPGQIEAFVAAEVLLATGGAGKVYLYTSNPDVATGDGIAMCYRAGARVANMEFFQFHPTCLYHPQAKRFLISEALRGEGARLRRINGAAFMQNYHEAQELAPRDVVARAIDHEMKAYGEDHVLLDITHLPAARIREHFPKIVEKCLTFGFDITQQPIPVVPAAHYCCGGVVSDENGCTDIGHLYVAGEVACTGLHGANRLASNSLLEGLVFGVRAARHALDHFEGGVDFGEIPPWDPGGAVDSDEEVVIAQNWDEIRRCMWNYVGIVRSDKRLQRALRRSELIQEEINDYYWNFKVTPDLIELRNLSLVSELVIRCAMQRRESRGLHFTIDYPETSAEFEGDTVIEPTQSKTKN